MIRIGIIGAGPNASGHAKYYHASPRATVVAVADVDLTRATALADQCNAKPVDDFRAFLDDVDAVVVSSPNFLHHDHALTCVAAGRHLYCEKPMGLDLTQARAIAAAVERAGVASTIGFSTRFSPPLQAMLRLQAQGALGDLISLWSRRLHYIDLSAVPAWRRDHARSGGLLLEINCHELDWMMRMGGPVASVYARMAAAPDAGPRGNDHLWFTLNFASAAVGTHEGSWVAATPSFLRGCHGTAGGCTTDEWGNQLFHAPLGQNREPVALEAPFDLRGHFLDCIEHGADPVADAAWGLEVMAVAEAIFESARTGEVVRLAPAEQAATRATSNAAA